MSVKPHCKQDCAYKDPAHRAAAAYMREYRAMNKEKMRQYRQTYWERKAAEAGFMRENTGNDGKGEVIQA